MATSEKEEHHFAWLSLVVAAVIGSVLGLLIHSFIIAVNVMDWLKRQPVATTDQIITSAGISRFIFQFTCLFQMLFESFGNNSYVLFLLNAMKVMSNYSGIWMTALLAVAVCLKISNFQNVLFLKLKRIVSQKTVHFIVGSVLLSVFSGVLHIWLYYTAVLTNTTQNFTVPESHNLNYFKYFILGNNVPLFIYVMASLLGAIYLCLHMSKIRTFSSSSLSLNNYYTALKTVLFCFLCYAFHVVSTLIVLYYTDSLSIVWINVMLNIFPAVHSVILIYKTPNLKTRFLSLLLWRHSMERA